MFTWLSISIHLSRNGRIDLVEPLWALLGTIASQERQRVLSEEVMMFKTGKSIILKAARVSSQGTAIRPWAYPDKLSNAPKNRRK